MARNKCVIQEQWKKICNSFCLIITHGTNNCNFYFIKPLLHNLSLAFVLLHISFIHHFVPWFFVSQLNSQPARQLQAFWAHLTSVGSGLFTPFCPWLHFQSLLLVSVMLGTCQINTLIIFSDGIVINSGRLYSRLSLSLFPLPYHLIQLVRP